MTPVIIWMIAIAVRPMSSIEKMPASDAFAQDLAQLLLVGSTQPQDLGEVLARQAAQLHVRDMRRVAARNMEADMVGDEGGKARGGVRRFRPCLLPSCDQPFHMLAHQREQQVFLGREVAVERGSLHADLGSQLPHRHRLIAVARDQVDRGVAQRRFCFLAVRPGCASHIRFQFVE